MTKQERCPLQVMLTVRDMKKSMAFYRDVLGFDMPECWPEGDQPVWASLMLGGQSVMLGQAMSVAETAQLCGDDEAGASWMTSMAEAFEQSQPGAGATFYLRVEDVDAYHDKLLTLGAKPAYAPKTQFYGIRDFGLEDPDGYRLLFYKEVKLDQCQSCGMPLADAQPGQMYCPYCTDPSGQLKPFEEILEGTVTGYFMDMQKMSRPEAEVAAKEHLERMPAWACRA